MTGARACAPAAGQVRGADEPLSIHWDCDEERKGKHGEHVPPYLATVTYLTSIGAPTLVLPVAADAHGRALEHAESERTGFASFPVVGKHLAFDGRLLHGAHRDDAPAADATASAHSGAHAEAASEPPPPERVTVLVNLWPGHHPMGVEPLTDALRAALPALADSDADWTGAFGASAAAVPRPPRRTCPEARARVWRIGSYIHPPVRVRGLAPLVCAEAAHEHFWSCEVAVEVVEDDHDGEGEDEE